MIRFQKHCVSRLTDKFLVFVERLVRQFSVPFKLDGRPVEKCVVLVNTVEMNGNLIDLGDHIEQPSRNMENLENTQSTKVSQPENSVQSTLKK